MSSIHQNDNVEDSSDEDDIFALLDSQNRELLSSQTLETDLDLAFDLQLQEALAFSLSLLSTSSSSSSSSTPPPPPPPENDAAVSSASLQSQEIQRLQQHLADRKLSQLEAKKTRFDLARRIHDQNVAREILRIPESEWADCGDDFKKPFDFDQHRPSSSSSTTSSSSAFSDAVFRLYFKGLVHNKELNNNNNNNNNNNVVVGLGVAICDPRDNLVFEISKPLVGFGSGKLVAESKALIEGLNAAVTLELKRVVVYCDYFPIYQLVIGRWRPKQRKIELLLNQVSLLRKKFTSCDAVFVPRNNIKHAFKLAKEATFSRDTGPALSAHGKNHNETCVICLEDVDVERMFSVDECKHRFCYSCMRQHVEVKLLHGTLPRCPHEGCKSELGVESCQKFLTPKSIETMKQRIKEASIPVTEKIYCPYPKCSALMSKTEVTEYAKDAFVGTERSGARKCLKCDGLFCINCKVPWHSNLTCDDYKRLNPNPPAEDVKLKFLATNNLWRQCVKCNHMIELAEGCFHMTCRCGYEFCYNCGAEWKNKMATCSCPLWEEDNIWFDDERGFFDEEDFDEDEDDIFESDEDDYIF